MNTEDMKRLRDAGNHFNRRQVFLYALIFVLVPILTFFTGRWLDEFLSFPRLPPLPFNIIFGLLVFLPGLSIGVKATRLLFLFGKGLPWGEFSRNSETKKMVDTGLYSYTRNPMTLGYSLLPCGMGLMFQSISMAVLPTLLTLATASLWVKLKEEPRLKQRFGIEYLNYKSKTPFLIPRPKPAILWLYNAFYSALPLRSTKDNTLKGTELPILIHFLLSVFGLSILVLMIFSDKMETQGLKHFVIASFVAICCLGASAAIVPTKCTNALHGKKNAATTSTNPIRNSSLGQKTFKGHHPTCGSFDNHVLIVRTKTFCAGCAGLFVGAILATIGSLAYLLGLFEAQGNAGLLVWIGAAGILLGLLQYLRPFTLKASVHFLLNVLFVFAAFLMLVAVIEMNGGVLVEIYYLTLTLYWILTRIVLSSREHQRICISCGSNMCAYGRRD